jgi:outer membrane protein TolC
LRAEQAKGVAHALDLLEVASHLSLLDLAAALARVQQACAAASAAGAQLLPTVDLDASATAQRQSLQSPLGTVANSFPGYNRYQREYTVGPAASWEIDLFGGLRRGADAATDEAQAAEAALSCLDGAR